MAILKSLGHFVQSTDSFKIDRRYFAEKPKKGLKIAISRPKLKI